MLVEFTTHAEQIERDFGIPHPRRMLFARLKAEDSREVTPFTESVGADRITEIVARGFTEEDAYVVLLMRGARREAVANAAGESVGDLVAAVRHRIRQVELEPLVGEALRTLNLGRHA